MKKIKISALLMMCLLVVSGFMFTACDNDDLSTNQFTGGVSLNVFGPCPVTRGGVLRFIGSGMDQVTGVLIPGCSEITGDGITVVSSQEIRVTVPEEAEEGQITLYAPGVTITTITNITFTETVTIESFEPSVVKPGDELTITGTYLELMHAVIFSDEVTVNEEDFISHSRYEIKLIVPAEAQTGEIGVSDLAMQEDGTIEENGIANEVYSDSILTVVLPAVTSVSGNTTAAKPGDVITIAGTDLDLVTSVLMPNDSIAEFTYDAADGTIAITLPTSASDGDVRIVPASGVEVTAFSLVMAVPTDLVSNPASELRVDDIITITGTNLDLVTNVTFPGMEEDTELASQSETEITVVMPEMAQSGDLVLNLISGKTVTLAISTAKPKNLVYQSASVGGGDNLVVTGDNLDLVVSVTFSGDVSVSTFVSQSETELTLVVPTTAESGVVTFAMNNGETVEGSELTITSPISAYLVSAPSRLVQGEVVELEIANGEHLTNLTINDVQPQFICDASSGILTLKVPSDMSGTCTMLLISDNGEVSYEVEIVGSETTIWEGEEYINWTGMQDLAWGGYDWSQVSAGQTLNIYLTEDTDYDYWQIRIANGSWEALTDWSALVGSSELLLDAGATSYSYTLTENDVEQLVNEGGLVLTGCYYTVTSITIGN